MSDPNAELFDLIADGYDEDVPFYSTLGRLLVSWAEPAAGARVLDIGAGRGAITRALVEARASAGSIVAGDISPKMVEHLTRLDLPGVQARLLDACALDLPDASFDLVFAGFVLTAIPDPVPALAELSRVLRPGGELLLSAPAPSPRSDTWWFRYGEIVDEYCRRWAESLHPDDEGLQPDDEGLLGAAAGDCPDPSPAHPHHDHGAVLERLGLRPEGRTAVEIDLPIGGPTAYWQWLQMHGNQWLFDALSESDGAEFRRRVLESLHDHHPAGGTRLIAGAGFERLVRR